MLEQQNIYHCNITVNSNIGVIICYVDLFYIIITDAWCTLLTLYDIYLTIIITINIIYLMK